MVASQYVRFLAINYVVPLRCINRCSCLFCDSNSSGTLRVPNVVFDYLHVSFVFDHHALLAHAFHSSVRIIHISHRNDIALNSSDSIAIDKTELHFENVSNKTIWNVCVMWG